MGSAPMLTSEPPANHSPLPVTLAPRPWGATCVGELVMAKLSWRSWALLPSLTATLSLPCTLPALGLGTRSHQFLLVWVFFIVFFFFFGFALCVFFSKKSPFSFPFE